MAAAGTTLASRLLSRHPPGGRRAWERRNHRGKPVSLIEGPSVAVGLVLALLASPSVGARVRLSSAGAVISAAFVGGYDDVVGSADTRGLGGHLAALRQGRLTSGAVKLAALGVTGLATTRALGADPEHDQLRLADAALVAGAANLLNLFDLRPGRALKLALLAAPALAAGGASAALLAPATGAALAALPADLAERSMLGDCGANALGAALGAALVVGAGQRVRLGGLAVVVASTLISERVSFSAVIARSRLLSWLDGVGRRDGSPG